MEVNSVRGRGLGSLSECDMMLYHLSSLLEILELDGIAVVIFLVAVACAWLWSVVIVWLVMMTMMIMMLLFFWDSEKE